MDKSELMYSKLMSLEELLRLVNVWRLTNKKIIFTNGCFDLLHAGHVDYLNHAANYGNKLVIGLNSDESVSKLKGPNRPVNSLKHRTMVLSSLHYVDAVVEFNEDTPLNLIQQIKPDILVKGADYQIENIVGADFVLKNGGEVHLIPFLDGFSSSLLMRKINQNSI